jgi:type II secretory pathway pseudopilin PulG
MGQAFKRFWLKLRGQTTGMSLIEIVVAFAIIALSALILLFAISTASSIIRRGADLDTASTNAYNEVEARANATPGAVSFVIDGQSYTVQGQYHKGEAVVNDVSQEYYYFEANR